MYSLFIYGTLKFGFPNNDLLKGVFHSKAKTPANYKLYNCGNYPALVACKNGLSISGELWFVSEECLKDLDEFEGVDIGLYKRELILLTDPCHLAFTYIFCRSVDNLKECGSSWEGDCNGFQTIEHFGERQSSESIAW